MSSLEAPTLDQAKIDFIIDFYRASDARDADKYNSFLTEDVHFTMGLKSTHGHSGVIAMRQAMWNGVKTRRHEPARAYSLDKQSTNDIMLHGTVSYELESGALVDRLPWAARMVFADGAALKLASYQVWLDGTPLKEALAKQQASS